MLDIKTKKKIKIFRISESRRKLKIQAVEYKGGKCQICGYNKCISNLVFHHNDPDQKDFGISNKGVYKKFDKIKSELDKCILLCHNCHGEVHYQKFEKDRLDMLEFIRNIQV